MAYIGNTVQNQGFSPAVDYFNGDGTTVTFTLSRPVASVAQLTAVIENVIQNPSTAFTVASNQITFTSAPPAGTNNIWVEYTSLVTTYAALSQDPSVVGDITASGGYLATGDFGNSFIDGTIVDYVTGNARITTGPSDAMTFYNGGTSSRTALMTLGSTGNVGIGTSSPGYKLDVAGAIRTTQSASATYATTIFENTASNGYVQTYFNIGSDGASGRASISYAPGIFFAVGPTNNDTTTPIVFRNNNATERMRIDTSGRVTTPYQPAFRAYSTTGSYSTTGVDIPFANTNFNIGSYYNTSNGKFTAPVDGVYAVLWSSSSYGATGFSLDLHKNGSAVSFSEQNNSLNYFVTGQCQLLYLNANDYITLRLRFGTINLITEATNFQAYLVG